jgi:5'-3' exoribonuclease 1
MGIPSYYRTLCDTVKGLLSKKVPTGTPVIGSLWLDFNCIVYHCIRRPGTPSYPGEEGRVEWENTLIHIVTKYVKHLISIVNPKSGVYIGVDGVVPMAKMLQQRKRRFKSIWLAQKEIELGKPSEPRWDTNCITPGTEFMERLGETLRKEIVGKAVTLSLADEPGEGEQKVFHSIDSGCPEGDIVVYGLDADLIVMSLYRQMNITNKLWLFREHTEFGGGVVYGPDQEEEYRFLNIEKLSQEIAKSCGSGNDAAEYIYDYCASMALLGNDFLPHSLWFTIRDGGHTLLQELLKATRKEHGPLTQNSGTEWRLPALIALCSQLAVREEDCLRNMIEKKFTLKGVLPKKPMEDWERNVADWNYTPLKEKAEKILLESVHPVRLSSSWRQTYYEEYLGAKTQKDIETIVQNYIQGLSWSLSYMTGSKDVSWSWMFPSSYPPLWQDIVDGLRKVKGESLHGPTLQNVGILPQEQLAMVLPLESWWLIRDKKLRLLPTLFPHMWNFGNLSFCTAGKRMMWECDPKVPLITPERLRFIQKAMNSSMDRWDKDSHNNYKILKQHMSEYITTSSDSENPVSDIV